MNNTWSKLVLAAVAAGFLASTSLVANETAAPATDAPAAEKANKCKGENGCSGKHKGEHKDHKGEHKANKKGHKKGKKEETK